MPEPLTITALNDLVVEIDEQCQARTWGAPPVLLCVEATPAGLVVGWHDLEQPPIPLLLGFTAPDEWLAAGVALEDAGPPLARSIAIVSRDGPVASAMRVGDDLFAMPEPTGHLADALRRALRLPTAPAEESMAAYAAALLVGTLVELGQRDGRRMGLSTVRAMVDGVTGLVAVGDWGLMRSRIADGSVGGTNLWPEWAAWMDDGMAARWLMDGITPHDELLDEARRVVSRPAWRLVTATLARWGLSTRQYEAA